MKHFLLIDDDEIFAHLLQRGFSRHGLTLDWAATSDAALAYPGWVYWRKWFARRSGSDAPLTPTS